MCALFNKAEVKDTRRYLRNHATQTEKIMWSHLRNNQLGGYKFRRQYSVGAYVLDFYVPQLRLAIEIDGASHATPEAMKHDLIRQHVIEHFDIRFLRFTDEEVLTDVEMVIDQIKKQIAIFEAVNIMHSL